MHSRTKWMGGNSQGKSYSGKGKVTSRGKEKFDFVILINDDDDDGDDDQLDDVVIIDGESAEGNLGDCGKLKVGERFPFEGIISIDDDDEEDNSDGNPGVHWGTGVYGNTSSSKRCRPSNFMGRSVGFDDDDCQVIHEKKSAFGLSKCRHAEPRKPPCEKGYGSIPQYMSSSEENDCSDCEVIEIFAENLHQKLEKTYKRRKYNATSSQMNHDDQKGVSQSHYDTPPDVQASSRTEDCCEGPGCSSPEESTFSDTCSSATPEINSENIFHKNERVPFDSSHFNETSYGKPFSREAEDPTLDSISNRKQCGSGPEHLHHGDGTIHCQAETFMGRERFKETDEYKQAAETEWSSRKRALQLHAEEAQRLREKRKAELQQAKKMRDIKDNEPNDEEVHDQSEADYNGNAKVMETPVYNGNAKECGPRDSHNVRFDDNAACDQSESVIGREKLKESGEYKQAVEAEWFARQQEIKLQAQEAQRLRRKKHAENRMLDMERRQKQRVEEMRETEKKDKENMDLKEQLRMEVRKNLSNLESACSDMASLLRGLGVHLASPSIHEVHAAYKRALLKFHPDRASRTDVRQQVEAEEKFKLISRMKEKYLSASCR